MHSIPGLVVSLFFLGFSLAGCKSGQNDKQSGEKPAQTQSRSANNVFRITEPRRDDYVKPGSEIEIGYERTGKEIKVDSVNFFIEGELIKTTTGNVSQTNMQIPDLPPGPAGVRLTIFMEDGTSESHSVRLKITSDREPEMYGYRVLNAYPHDKGAYTQGFEYYDGFLFEGTGNYGESSLRKADLETGEIMKFRSLASNLFGEGITRINNKIYQITYRAQVGFVYDENNFELIRKIYYQIKEGWGLSNNGEYILMSDGSHIIYYMDTTYFSVVKKIEVFDHEKEVDKLNELEMINGVLYANLYTTNEIVMIDPGTGRLLGRIDLNGLLDPSDRHPSIDFLNGIAYDRKNDRIFVTGKYWPKVYEVEFFRK